MGARTFRVRREGANDTPAHGKLRKKKPASQQQNTRLELGLVQDKKERERHQVNQEENERPAQKRPDICVEILCGMVFTKNIAITGNSKICFLI